VIEEFLGINARKKYPTLMREFLVWLQECGAEEAVVDNINVAKRTAISSFYYPRVVTSALLVKRKTG
jgi:hypothetical protein